MGYLKGRSAIRIFEKYPELKKKWHNEFWTTGYYVTTVGDGVRIDIWTHLMRGCIMNYVH